MYFYIFTCSYMEIILSVVLSRLLPLHLFLHAWRGSWIIWSRKKLQCRVHMCQGTIEMMKTGGAEDTRIQIPSCRTQRRRATFVPQLTTLLEVAPAGRPCSTVTLELRCCTLHCTQKLSNLIPSMSIFIILHHLCVLLWVPTDSEALVLAKQYFQRWNWTWLKMLNFFF